MRILLISLLTFALASCADTKVAERRPVPPPGSDDANYKAWNDPSIAPRTGGQLGGLLEGR